MIQTVTVGTDGSDTASKAVEFALDIAEKFGAKVVVASSYRPVSEDRLRREQRTLPKTSSGPSIPPRTWTRRCARSRRRRVSADSR